MNITLSDFKLPPPKDLANTDTRIDLITKSITRIYDAAVEMRPNTASDPGPDVTIGGPMDMWMLLTVRMITRVAEPPELDDPSSSEDTPMDNEKKDVTLFYERQDRLRRTLCEYIMSDFPGR